ncbi:MAG: hypothetical protein L3J37_10305 [Rhodobacteraceae bacterium]|nr:hypothetical protein [Paracoccaceae bacterium]
MNSIFSTYSQGENRVTSTIIQVLKNLPINVVEQFLIMFSESDEQEYFGFNNQVKGEGSVPDAEISAKFSLLFETKVKQKAVGARQLRKHLEFAKNRKSLLVYLTPDIRKPKELTDAEVVWKSFQDVYDLIGELIEDTSLILSERDQFLLKNLQDFFSDSGLLPKPDQVLVIAARIAWPAYCKHGVYICQSGRSFRDVDWLGFYSDGVIQSKVAKVEYRNPLFSFSDSDTVSAQLLEENSTERFGVGPEDLQRKLQGWFDGNQWAIGKTVQLFSLSGVDSAETETLDGPIKNNLKGRGGKGTAYTQSQRYVPLAMLKSSKLTSELK